MLKPEANRHSERKPSPKPEGRKPNRPIGSRDRPAEKHSGGKRQSC